MTFVCALERSERPGTKRCDGQCPSCATWWLEKSERVTAPTSSDGITVGQKATDDEGRTWRCVAIRTSRMLGAPVEEVEWRLESMTEADPKVAVCSRCGKGSADNIDSQGRCAACGSPFLMLRAGQVWVEPPGVSGDSD